MQDRNDMQIGDDTKVWYRSKTIWGGLVALGAALGGLVGIDVDPGAQAGMAQALLDLAAALGAVLAIFGRYAADRPIR